MTRYLMKLTTRILMLPTLLLMLPAIAVSSHTTQVGLNKSVTIILKNPVQRCESADPAIAGCIRITPTQLQINGVASGKTTLTVLDIKGKKITYEIRVRELKEIELRKMVVIDLQKPITRWQATNPAIVKCVKISPSRLQIDGMAVGETSVTIWDNAKGKESFDLVVRGESQGFIRKNERGTAYQRTEAVDPTMIGHVVARPKSEIKKTAQTVRRSEAITQPVEREIALHSSEKIPLVKPAQRCESDNPAVVECVSIKAKQQIQITGMKMGRASVAVVDENGGKQIFTVRVKGYQELVLPLSTMNLPRPVTRCEPLDTSLKCFRITPTQLQISGTTLGKSALTVWEEGGGEQTYDIHVKGYEVPLNKIELLTVDFTLSDPRHGAAHGKDSPVGEQTIFTPIIADKEIATIVERSNVTYTPVMDNGHSRSTLIVKGVKIGETSLIIMEREGRSQSFNIRVKPDLSELEEKIREAAPNDRITVAYANETLVLSGKATNDLTITKIELLAKAYANRSDVEAPKAADGTVAGQHGKPHEIYKIINLIQIDNPQQVLLEVKVAQVDKQALKSLGVTAFVKGTKGEGFASALNSPTSLGGSLAGSATALGAIASPFDAYQLGFSLFKPGIGAALTALVTNKKAKILAEPNLLVRSGEEGNFLAGSKIPYPVLQSSNGASTTTVIWQDVGVKLKFKPEVLENGMINLKIDPAEVSNVTSTSVGGYPVIDSREVRTSVQLKEGESLVLAGLLQSETIKSLSKIPFMGDIPILGALFRSTSDDIMEKELVFFITPRLMKPSVDDPKPEILANKALTAEQQAEFQWMPRK